MTTSRAVVGSSRIMTCGSSAMAIAIMARWRMPPDSSCAWLRSRSAFIPTMPSNSPALDNRSDSEKFGR